MNQKRVLPLVTATIALFLFQTCHAEASGIPLQPTSPMSTEGHGIEATYCFNVSIPSMDQAAVVYVRYVVLPDEWAARVDWDAGFINGMFSPPLAGTTLHKKAGLLTITGPHTRTAGQHPIVERPLAERYNSQSYPLRQLAPSLYEAQVWRLPHQMNTPDADSPRILSSVTTTKFSSGDAVCRTSIQGIGSNKLQVDQQINGLPGRSYRDFSTFQTRNNPTFAAGECIIESTGQSFRGFNEVYLGESSPSNDSKLHSSIQVHRGGRHIRLNWSMKDDIPTPSAIEVTLGTTGTGMLLQSARLVSSTKLSVQKARSGIARILENSDEAWLLTLSRSVGQLYWGKSPERLSEEDRQKAAHLESQLDEYLAADPPVGSKIGVLRNKLILVAATDSETDRSKFRTALAEYLEAIGRSADTAGQLAVSFDLLEMLRYHEQHEEERIAREQLRSLLAPLPASRQIRALFYARGATEVKDVHATQLMTALSSPESKQDLDDRTFRAALALAATEVRSVCNRTRSAEGSNQVRDPLQTSRESQLLDNFSDFLQFLSTRESPEIQQAGANLQQLEKLLRSGQ